MVSTAFLYCSCAMLFFWWHSKASFTDILLGHHAIFLIQHWRKMPLLEADDTPDTMVSLLKTEYLTLKLHTLLKHQELWDIIYKILIIKRYSFPPIFDGLFKCILKYPKITMVYHSGHWHPLSLLNSVNYPSFLPRKSLKEEGLLFTFIK